MDEKEFAKAQEVLKAKCIEIAQAQNPMELAKIVGEPFDPENRISDIISAAYNTDTVDIGEDYEYFTVDVDTKKVTTVTNGSVTQTAVTPLTTTDLTFSTYSSEEFLVYLDKLLEGKHDMIAKKRLAIAESLDRKEQQIALNIIDAAVPAGNQFTLDSGDTKLTFPKIAEMIKALAPYVMIERTADGRVMASNAVFISGCDVTQDLVLLDYDADKNREVNLMRAGIGRWIAVEDLAVTTDASAADVIDQTKAYLVAPSFRTDRESGHFVRRRVAGLDGAGAKERITIARGPILPEGSNPKWAFSTAGVEQFGAVWVNSKVIASFERVAP